MVYYRDNKEVIEDQESKLEGISLIFELCESMSKLLDHVSSNAHVVNETQGINVK